MRPGCPGGRCARSTRGTLWPDRGSSPRFPTKTIYNDHEIRYCMNINTKQIYRVTDRTETFFNR